MLASSKLFWVLWQTEKDLPAPPFSSPSNISIVSSTVGYPAVTYVTSAERFSCLHFANVALIASILDEICGCPAPWRRSIEVGRGGRNARKWEVRKAESQLSILLQMLEPIERCDEVAHKRRCDEGGDYVEFIGGVR